MLSLCKKLCKSKTYVRDCLEYFLILPISLIINENSKKVLALQKNVRYFNKFYPAAI